MPVWILQIEQKVSASENRWSPPSKVGVMSGNKCVHTLSSLIETGDQCFVTSSTHRLHSPVNKRYMCIGCVTEVVNFYCGLMLLNAKARIIARCIVFSLVYLKDTSSLNTATWSLQVRKCSQRECYFVGFPQNSRVFSRLLFFFFYRIRSFYSRFVTKNWGHDTRPRLCLNFSFLARF